MGPVSAPETLGWVVKEQRHLDGTDGWPCLLMPAPPTGLTSLACLPQDQRGSCAIRHGNSGPGHGGHHLCPSSILMELDIH